MSPISWTTPKTFVTGNTLPASDLNTHLRDNLNQIWAGTAATIRRSAVQSISDNVVTAISWDTQSNDVGDVWDISLPTRLTLATVGKGIAIATLEWAANATGYRLAHVKRSDGAFYGEDRRPTISGVNVENMVAGVVEFTAGQYFTIEGYQNSGGALNVTGYVGIIQIGAWAP